MVKVIKPKDERQQTNSSLANERTRTDKAFAHYKKELEGATDAEINVQKSELSALLGQIRDTTDIDILKERAQIDSDAKKSTNLLLAEQSAHLSTRAELTTREEFFAIVSHDLKNPIGSISSCADVLLSDPVFANISNEMRHWVEFMKRNADSSLRLIGDILDMERIAEGKLNLHMARTNLSDLVHELVENHAQIALSKSILIRALPTLSSGIIEVDRDRISQVLSNLIGNAIKFTPVGGSITISLQELEHEVQVSVKDSGPGIAKDQQVHIFERFAQIHNKDRSGLGLGLYIAKMFVELHHGKLWVNSTLGEGSTFHFTLSKQMAGGDGDLH